jgi:hypothetical protein
MKSDLLKGPAATKEERRELLLAARPAIKVIVDALNTRLTEKEIAQQKPAEYELAAWPYKQADHIGSIRELRYVIDLLSLDQEDSK